MSKTACTCINIVAAPDRQPISAEWLQSLARDAVATVKDLIAALSGDGIHARLVGFCRRFESIL
ncbi:MAG: hypothetical protein ACTHNN_04160 [Xanthobacteraceae bacterium]